MKTVDDLKRQLSQGGSLTTLLLPDEFAGEDQVAAHIAQAHKNDLKPNQARRIFHTFKELDRANGGKDAAEPLSEEDRMRLTLVVPELAYATGRNLIPKEFYEVVKLCLAPDKMQTVGDLRRLVQFLSAILAYQKFYG